MLKRKKSVLSKISRISTIFFSLLGALYILYAGRSLILPPVVNFDTIEDGTAFEYPLVILKGATKRTKTIRINNYPIILSPEGTFEHDILLSPGSNTIIVTLIDNFSLRKTESFTLFCRKPCAPYITPQTTKKDNTQSVDDTPKTEDTIDIITNTEESTPQELP